MALAPTAAAGKLEEPADLRTPRGSLNSTKERPLSLLTAPQADDEGGSVRLSNSSQALPKGVVNLRLGNPGAALPKDGADLSPMLRQSSDRLSAMVVVSEEPDRMASVPEEASLHSRRPSGSSRLSKGSLDIPTVQVSADAAGTDKRSARRHSSSSSANAAEPPGRPEEPTVRGSLRSQERSKCGEENLAVECIDVLQEDNPGAHLATDSSAPIRRSLQSRGSKQSQEEKHQELSTAVCEEESPREASNDDLQALVRNLRSYAEGLVEELTAARQENSLLRGQDRSTDSQLDPEQADNSSAVDGLLECREVRRLRRSVSSLECQLNAEMSEVRRQSRDLSSYECNMQAALEELHQQKLMVAERGRRLSSAEHDSDPARTETNEERCGRAQEPIPDPCCGVAPCADDSAEAAELRKQLQQLHAQLRSEGEEVQKTRNELTAANEQVEKLEEQRVATGEDLSTMKFQIRQLKSNALIAVREAREAKAAELRMQDECQQAQAQMFGECTRAYSQMRQRWR
eukprot:TRINITY_DN15948_c0_g1_i2.p1 TRINITY_DN15948_c0_g1~~TRINITY_DN15948_c0_g1_i2.p1  ORF type:complete len:517 (-),score=97.50 TRINITY_DN15948_c0_g1_i2:1116-2666(-)